MRLFNLSHPLNDDAKRVLRDKYGVTDIVRVPFQLDTARPIEPQVREVLEHAGVPTDERVAIVPPGYAPAAIVVACERPNATFIRLANVGGTPPKWMPVEALRGCGR